MKLTRKSFPWIVALATTFAHLQTNNIKEVQHVIVVIQENRTPNNLFQEDTALINAGAHIVASGLCGTTVVPLTQTTGLYTCWDPDHSHGASSAFNGAWETMWDHGKMDGACKITIGLSSGCQQPACQTNGPGGASTCPYTYVDNAVWNSSDPHDRILDPYFQIAGQFGFANYMFQTSQGPSFPAHQFLFSGTSAPVYANDPSHFCTNGTDCWKFFDAENRSGKMDRNGCLADSGVQVYLIDENSTESYDWFNPGQGAGFPCYDHATLTDLLDNQTPKITWKYYARGAADLWTAPNAIDHICGPSGGSCNNTEFKNHVVLPVNGGDQAPILTDISNCNLPAVSWVIPDGNWSDHAGWGHTQGAPAGDGGPSWVAAIVNAVGNATNCDTNGYWKDTVILITWDDWGGYFDDVAPPDCQTAPCTGYSNGSGQQYVYGFRVPLLVVGAYATPGYISGANVNPPVNCLPPNTYCHDFGSVLNFIEYAFGTGGNHLGGQFGIGGQTYPYADALVMDTTGPPNNYSLYDFFDFTKFNQFQTINGAKYSPTCFHNPTQSNCFPYYPLDPDNDAND